MRELFLSAEESTPTSLVFQAAQDDVGHTAAGDSFFLSLDDTTRALLHEALSRDPLGEPGEAVGPGEGATHADIPDKDDRGNGPDVLGTEEAPAREKDEKDEKEQSATPTAPDAAADSTISEDRERGSSSHASSKRSSGPDPRLSAPLTLRPREIQERIRAGATIQQLADEMGVTESRVEPFAHPVLLERERIADLAKHSHPVREDGPARLTLWEILATAFAARSYDLSDSQWDSYRDSSGQWVVRVTWTAGQSTNVAEWTFQNHQSSSPTAVPRNTLAAELTDPEFASPVRSFSAIDGDADLDHDDDGDEYESSSIRNVHAARERDTTRDQEATAPEQELHGPSDPDTPEEDFLQHPDPTQDKRPAKRRRRAVTPHWEDVLLGVRTNTKRPRK